MILGIASLGKGRLGKSKRVELWGIHVLGSVIGGGVAGVSGWALAVPARTFLPAFARLALLMAILLASTLIDGGILRRPTTGPQVPPTWTRRYGLMPAFALYGMWLGAGFLTRVHHGAVIGVFSVAALLFPPGPALVTGALFGLGRAFAVGVGALAPTQASRILYRSTGSHWLWPKVSLIVTGLLGATVLSSRWGP
jgi:hypothetical protein